MNRNVRTLRQNRRYTSDIWDLLDSKFSSNSPPRAVACHSFLAVNFPLIGEQSIGLSLHERECTGEGKSTHCIRATSFCLLFPFFLQFSYSIMFFSFIHYLILEYIIFDTKTLSFQKHILPQYKTYKYAALKNHVFF